MEQSNLRVADALIITFLIITASYIAQAVFEPVIFALFIIALIWPLQQHLQSRIPKAAALVVTILVTLGAIVALSSMVAWGGGQIADWISQNLGRIQTTFVSSTKWLEDHDIFIVALVTEHFNAGVLIGVLQTVALRVNTFVGFALLVLIYIVMIMAETEGFQSKLFSLKNEDTSRRLLHASAEIARKFRKYMIVRTMASIATGLAVWIFALLAGLENALAWGVLTFALNYLPYVGPLVVTILPALFAFVQFGSWEMAAFIFAGLILIQFFIGSYLEPVFSGTALAMSPTVVVFAVLFWTFLWGIPGAFIGVPLAIAFLTLCEQFPSSRWIATMFSGDSAQPHDQSVPTGE